MEIKLNVGASPIWRKDGWHVLDHKIKKSSVNKAKLVKGEAAKIYLKDGSCSVIFCSHTLEHIPHYHIQRVLLEFSRVLKIGGILRIIVPDLKKVARAYVNNDKAFFKKALGESEKIRLDLGLGGQLMNYIISPGQDTILLNRDLNKFIGGYAHIYAYDFEMFKILLKACGFGAIKERKLGQSSVLDLREPLHVVGMEKKWQNLNAAFYKKHNLKHEYKNGKYQINFTITGFDRNPIASLIVEAKKIKNINKKNVPDINGVKAANYNHYGFSLLYDKNVKKRLKLLGISANLKNHFLN
jgi:SAM-dependent methyltransferase